MRIGKTFLRGANRQSAFTRIDLMVTVLTLALLAAMILPALARTHVKPQGTQCLYNLRQIILAWQMYADDSNGKMAVNHGAFPANPDYATPPSGITYRDKWVNGNMQGGTTGAPFPPYSGIDTTNTALLVDPSYSSLGPYVKNPALYRCPSDVSTWLGLARVRSYSMNAGVGCAFNGTRQDPGHSELGHWLMGSGASTPGPWQTYIKNSDLIGQLPPSDLFVLLDEHPNSINDSSFAVYMPTSPYDANARWIDIPSNYHAGGCDFAFADGHVAFHKWANPGLIPAPVWTTDQTASRGNGGTLPTTLDSDMLWLAHHTTCPQPGAAVLYYPP